MVRQKYNLWLLLYTSMILIIVTCGPNFNLSLDHGYQLVVCNSTCVLVANKQKREIVPPHIEAMNTKKGIAFGFRVDEKSQKPKGYFILNMVNDSLWLNLEISEWNTILSKQGINEKPKLIQPSFFFGLLRGK